MRIHADDPHKTGRFRHAAWRERFDDAYDRALAAWPTPPTPMQLPTPFGVTHVNTCGASAGTPIVLLHAMFMTSLGWLPNVAALGERHPIYAVDTICDAGRSGQERRIRTGEELAAWLDAVLAGLELDRVHLVGLSYGSWLGLNQALRSPARLASVTAIEPPGVITRGSLKVIWEMVRGGVLRSDRAFDRLTRFLGGGTLPPPPILDVMRCAFRDFKVVQPFAELLDDDELGAIRTPVLLLFGERSPMSDARRAVGRARRCMPDVQAEIIPGTAHTPPLEDPPLVNRKILKFVERIDRV